MTLWSLLRKRCLKPSVYMGRYEEFYNEAFVESLTRQVMQLIPNPPRLVVRVRIILFVSHYSFLHQFLRLIAAGRMITPNDARLNAFPLKSGSVIHAVVREAEPESNIGPLIAWSRK